MGNTMVTPITRVGERERERERVETTKIDNGLQKKLPKTSMVPSMSCMVQY